MSRAASTSAAPARAIALAVSAPIPRLAPVTTARRPSSNRSISARSGSKRWRAILKRDHQAHDQDGKDADVVGDVRCGPRPDADRDHVEQPDQHAEGRERLPPTAALCGHGDGAQVSANAARRTTAITDSAVQACRWP